MTLRNTINFSCVYVLNGYEWFNVIQVHLFSLMFLLKVMDCCSWTPQVLTTIDLYKMGGWYFKPNNLHGVLRGHPFYKDLAAGNPFLLATTHVYKMGGCYMKPKKIHGVLRGHPFYKDLAAGNQFLLATKNVYKMGGWYMNPKKFMVF